MGNNLVAKCTHDIIHKTLERLGTVYTGILAIKLIISCWYVGEYKLEGKKATKKWSDEECSKFIDKKLCYVRWGEDPNQFSVENMNNKLSKSHFIYKEESGTMRKVK